MLSKIKLFFAESKQEFMRVNWPTSKETLHLTLVVVGMSLGVAVFLGIFDFLFAYLLSILIV